VSSLAPRSALLSAVLPRVASELNEPSRPIFARPDAAGSDTSGLFGIELPHRFSRRVLVVEDESPIRQLLADLLNEAGYGVLQAGDGQEAWRILRDDRPDLIVLDVMLPRRNGWQFLQRSREDLDRANVPVLIVSAVAGHGDAPISLGVAAWLSKPLDLDRSVAAVESLAGPAHRVPRLPITASRNPNNRLLVVEDDVSIRNILVEYLRDEGYVVEAAGSIREARDRIAAARPDLILLDLMLPGQSGWDFLRERSNDARLANTPVLVLSAAPRNLLLEARDLGADAFLSKPFDLDFLGAIIQSFVA
jgi:DNA-binding response OmpR family regulator